MACKPSQSQELTEGSVFFQMYQLFCRCVLAFLHLCTSICVSTLADVYLQVDRALLRFLFSF